MLSIVLRHVSFYRSLFLSLTFKFFNFLVDLFFCSLVSFVSSSLTLSLSLIQLFLSALLYILCPFLSSSVSLLHFLSLFLSVCLPVSLSGVARVKLTTPDKDNSLTHSVVYFPPLSLHPSVIPHSSFIHPAVQPCLMVFSVWLLLSICFTSPVFSSGGQPILPSYLFIVLSAVLLLPSTQHQSIHLSFWLSLHLCLPLNGSICLSMHPYVSLTLLFSLLLNLFNPVSTPPHLCQIIRLTPSFHFFISSSLTIPSSCPLPAFHNVSCMVNSTYSGYGHIWEKWFLLIYPPRLQTSFIHMKKQNITAEMESVQTSTIPANQTGWQVAVMVNKTVFLPRRPLKIHPPSRSLLEQVMVFTSARAPALQLTLCSSLNLPTGFNTASHYYWAVCMHQFIKGQ